MSANLVPRRPSCGCALTTHRPRRIVLTGGPGAGKTAVLEIVKQHFCDHVVVLPEAASIVFGGGFPRYDSPAARRGAQLAIFHVQDQMEQVELALGRAALILCDRGIPDGLAYWPGTEAEFWLETGARAESTLARYEAVIHLRTPTAERGYDHRNPLRLETAEQAAMIDTRIEAAWAGHPRRRFVPSAHDFLDKVRTTLDALATLLPECCRVDPHGGVR